MPKSQRSIEILVTVKVLVQEHARIMLEFINESFSNDTRPGYMDVRGFMKNVSRSVIDQDPQDGKWRLAFYADAPLSIAPAVIRNLDRVMMGINMLVTSACAFSGLEGVKSDTSVVVLDENGKKAILLAVVQPTGFGPHISPTQLHETVLLNTDVNTIRPEQVMSPKDGLPRLLDRAAQFVRWGTNLAPA